MHSSVPKQFLKVYGKPVIAYTLLAFQNHPDIDAIAVVCIDGWQERLWEYAKEYGITKLSHVITGGSTGQESIRNGIYELEKHYEREREMRTLCLSTTAYALWCRPRSYQTA